MPCMSLGGYTDEDVTLQDHENIATIQLAVDCWAAKDLDIPRHYRSKAWFHGTLTLISSAVGFEKPLRGSTLSCWVQVQLMCKYLDSQGKFKGILEVPDPYYGGAKGFELVRLDLPVNRCRCMQPGQA